MPGTRQRGGRERALKGCKICQLEAQRIICLRRARRAQGHITLLSIKAAHNTGLSFFGFTDQLNFRIQNY